MSALGDNTQISYVNFSSVCMSVCLCVVCNVFVTFLARRQGGLVVIKSRQKRDKLTSKMTFASGKS